MPTEEFKKLLDRGYAKVIAQDITSKANPLLIEVTNYASWAFQRCQTGSCGHENVDVAPFVLYRHIIEMIDGVQVLVGEACSVATLPLLRAAFEASLALDYILAEDNRYTTRSLSWLHAYIHRQIETYTGLDPNTKRGAEFKEAWEGADLGGYDPPMEKAREHVEDLKKVLERQEFTEVRAEFERLCKDRRKPEWYRLFDGPSNLRELAQHLGKGPTYDVLYRRWSTVVHAGDLSAYMTLDESGTPVFKGIRYPELLPNSVTLAVHFMVHSTRIMITKFRPGENLARWYRAEIRPGYSEFLRKNSGHAL
jgi:hypothetical protein